MEPPVSEPRAPRHISAATAAAQPEDLPFSPESLSQVSDRVAAAVEDWARRSPSGTAFVSHEDPLHGARLSLTSEIPDEFHRDKPTHCSVTTLEGRPGDWSVLEYWEPTQ